MEEAAAELVSVQEAGNPTHNASGQLFFIVVNGKAQHATDHSSYPRITCSTMHSANLGWCAWVAPYRLWQFIRLFLLALFEQVLDRGGYFSHLLRVFIQVHLVILVANLVWET